MSFLVLAFAGPEMAFAQSSLVPVSFSEETAAPVDGQDFRQIDSELLVIANMTRDRFRLSSLDAHAGLSAIAAAHARDMAARGYVGYVDGSGVSLFDQVRKSDRTSLISSFGSSIAVVDAGATPQQIHDAIEADAANAANLRREFSHAGMGTFVSGDRLYVVQLFARIDGELSSPLPMQVAGKTIVNPAWISQDMEPVGWSLTDARGELVARGTGRRVQANGQEPFEGYLNVDVALGPDVYTLRGPFVQMN